MKEWQVDILIWPDREVSTTIVAPDSVAAMIGALQMLKLHAGETLHDLHAHIGRGLERPE